MHILPIFCSIIIVRASTFTTCFYCLYISGTFVKMTVLNFEKLIMENHIKIWGYVYSVLSNLILTQSIKVEESSNVTFTSRKMKKRMQIFC